MRKAPIAETGATVPRAVKAAVVVVTVVAETADPGAKVAAAGAAVVVAVAAIAETADPGATNAHRRVKPIRKSSGLVTFSDQVFFL